MICPTDMVQMHQFVQDGNPVGGGYAGENQYTTYELKQCPRCNRIVLEFYTAIPFETVDGAKAAAGHLGALIEQISPA